MKHEDRLQIAVMRYIKYQYGYALAIHPANERKTSPIAGAVLKRKGVLRGVSDILIFNPNKTHNGLAIELKVKPNKPTGEQLAFLTKLRAECNWMTAICYTFEEAQDIIDDYFEL